MDDHSIFFYYQTLACVIITQCQIATTLYLTPAPVKCAPLGFGEYPVPSNEGTGHRFKLWAGAQDFNLQLRIGFFGNLEYTNFTCLNTDYYRLFPERIFVAVGDRSLVSRGVFPPGKSLALSGTALGCYDSGPRAELRKYPGHYLL